MNFFMCLMACAVPTARWAYARLLLRGLSIRLLETQSCRIDAVALPGCLAWTILKKMSQVRAAIFTDHLCAFHKERAILVQLHFALSERAIEARPA